MGRRAEPAGLRPLPSPVSFPPARPLHARQAVCPTNDCGGTALHMAASRAWPGMVQLLVGLGCPLGMATLAKGCATAMHVAAAEANREPAGDVLAVMRVLADAAAAAHPPVDLIAARDADQKQPLHWAAEWAGGNTVAMRFLR